MRTSHLAKLNAMFEQSQKSVVSRKSVCLGSPDVAARGKRGNCPERVSVPKRFVRSTVNQLQELHGELYVTKAAWAEFDLRIYLGVSDVLGHALAHFLR